MTRSCVEWWLSGCLAGWETTPQWTGSGSSPPTGLTTGKSLWTMQVVKKAIIKCSSEVQNDLCGKRLVGNFF